MKTTVTVYIFWSVDYDALYCIGYFDCRFINGLDIIQEAGTTYEDLLLEELEAYGYTGESKENWLVYVYYN